MKRSVLVTLWLCLGLLIIVSSASAESLFGPKQYVRTKGAADVYIDAFSVTPGAAMLYIKNGAADGSYRVSSAEILLNGQEIFGTEDFSQAVYILEAPVNLLDNNSLTVKIKKAKAGSYLFLEITRSLEPPMVDITVAPEIIETGQSSTLSWTSTNADSCTIEPDIGSVDVKGSMTVSPTETTTYTITADGSGGTTTDSITVTVSKQEVILFGPKKYIRTKAPADIFTETFSATPGEATITIENGAQDGTQRIADASICIHGQEIFAPSDFGKDVYLLETDVNLTKKNTIEAQLLKGREGSYITIRVTRKAPLPSWEGSYAEQYEDLIPPDSTATYEPKRFSLITGRIQDQAGYPITGVSVTIHGHLEYGTASTDAAGQFTIPVNGGNQMIVVCRKAGLITAHRKVQVPWNNIATAKTVQMITRDTISTTVILDGNPETLFTHQGTQVRDESGTRSCTVVLTGDNVAYEIDEEGNVIGKLTSLTTRATEFTRPQAMPAGLPANSGYTYCAELSVDAVERVRFDKPVVTWVDNFLGFDVGDVVPVGYYDRDRGEWVPSENGAVVRLLDTDADGIVDALDADGDGHSDDLNGDGSFGDEVGGLNDPQRYPPGSTFWRVAVTHFTPWDYNWPYGLPPDAASPNPVGQPCADQQLENDSRSVICSFVEDRSRIFHEDIPVPGTDTNLHYASNRVGGYKTIITIPASGYTVPASLKNIVVNVEIAGQTLEQILDPLPNQITEVVWNGLDHMGRKVTGTLTAKIRIGFVYPAVYMKASDAAASFAQFGSAVTGIASREDKTVWEEEIIEISIPASTIADGWTLSSHHYLNPTDPSTLHKGDGTTNRNQVITIETVAGNGIDYICGKNYVQATQTSFALPQNVIVDSAGNLYIVESYSHKIRKVDTNGVITPVAGQCKIQGYRGDGGLAATALFAYPHGGAFDSAGNLYVADINNHRIRKIDKNGIISSVAGNGIEGFGGDGGPATEASLWKPHDVAVDRAGNLYIADTWNQRVRKVDTSGVITTAAGSGPIGPDSGSYGGDAGLATQAFLNQPHHLTVDGEGNLYVADVSNQRVRKVDTIGIITTVAGNGTEGFHGDGGPATEASLSSPHGVAADSAGNLYIADVKNHRIRKIDTSGVITTVAGNGLDGFHGDGGPATAASLFHPHDVAVDSAGSLYIADTANSVIRKVAPPSVFTNWMTSGEIPFAEEGGLAHIMNSAGKHQKTIDLDTGIALRHFGYNQNDELISITDQFGNQTTIQRDANGIPYCITSPDGIMTTLTVDSNDQLTRVTYPDGGYYGFEYADSALATAKIQPEGNRFDHVFDANGRITDFTDEEGGHWQFFRSANANGNILAEVLTGEENLTSYLDHTDSTGEYASIITDPTGDETSFARSNDEINVNKTLASGMELSFKYGLDPEYKAKYIKELTETTPSSLEKTTHRGKTYEDTNSDDIPDLVTETVTINGKTTFLENHVLQSYKTITSPEGRSVSAFYDPQTLLTTNLTIPGLHATDYGYDTRGRLTSINTHTRETTFSYNTQGFLESITDPQNRTTIFTHDSIGRVTGIKRPDGSTVGFDYDLNGNMIRLTNPLTIEHGFAYSKVNLKSSYQAPLSGSYGFVFDKDRRLVQTNFPSRKQINNVYDTTSLVQVQTPEETIDLSYLYGTRLGSMTNGTDTITYEYDGTLVTSEALTGTLNQTLFYAYNNDFNLQCFTYAGNTHTCAYDDDGLLTGAGAFSIIRNVENGLPEAIAGGELNLTRTFNGYGEVESQEFTVSGNNVTSWNLTRNDAGLITAKTEQIDGSTSQYLYTYDSMGRLQAVIKDATLVAEYEYGPNGTRTHEMNALRGISERTFDYSDEDHLLGAGSTTYQYDLDGFLTSKIDGSDITRYNYSSRGELLSTTLPNGTLIEYVHDSLGRRIGKKVNGIITEKYLWWGMIRLMAIYDGSDNLLMRFEYADNRLPLAMIKQGTTYHLTYDQVGSLRVVADVSGKVVKRLDYDLFGNVVDDTNPAFQVPFGFAGGLRDRDTGLVRFCFRDYDPDIGRWSAKDPIGFAAGNVDLYGYCLNDPVNLVDPYGLWDLISSHRALHGSKHQPRPTVIDPKIYEYVEWLKKQGVDRRNTDPYLHKRIYGSMACIPDYIRNYEPGTLWGNIVDDIGNHPYNQRLPEGYHLSAGDKGHEGVYVHQDAHNPLEGPVETGRHYIHEVRPNLSSLYEPN